MLFGLNAPFVYACESLPCPASTQLLKENKRAQKREQLRGRAREQKAIIYIHRSTSY